MCGIAGLLDPSRQKSTDELVQNARAMAHALAHRGPDDSGTWAEVETGIAMGHRRLAIIDLSAEGHQPMHSASRRYVMTFNGEVYNFTELRQRLEKLGHTFRGHSDTEVMLAAISQWGLTNAVQSFIGMFAFALWDRQEQLLYLGRDRLGIKPLYYGWAGQVFLFGSELKALRACPAFNAQINHDALALYLRHGYVPTPYSIYTGIYKLQPGTILTISAARPGFTPAPSPYWSVRQVVDQGLAEPFTGSATEAALELEARLREAVTLRLVADVPVGALLSGGIDSSLVVALMQAQAQQPTKTFTVGFYEADYDEAQSARAVAHHLGTDHTELYVTPEQFLAIVPRLPILYDEPFADPSQFPTFLISELARQQVTVSLSGDGGDELFTGYDWYFRNQRTWQRIQRVPAGIRKPVTRLLTLLSPPVWESLFHSLIPLGLRPHNLDGSKPHHLAEILNLPPERVYQFLRSHWKHPAGLVMGATEPPTSYTDPSQWSNVSELMAKMMYLDTLTYLPDDILTKVDRASMGVSLEVRVPLLDHRVLEFAWRLPLALKVQNGQGKWLLRQVLYRYVPQSLVERPKKGFSVPIAAWLRGPLRDWAERLLDEGRLRQEGYFNPEPIRQKWLEHLAGKHNWYYYLWDILMFQAWLERWGRGCS